MRTMEKFHAAIPDSVKKDIFDNMTWSDGYIRVNVCTVAFGYES